MAKAHNRQRFILLLGILLLATFLRFHRIEAQSFWNDEGNSARLSERPIPLIIEGTASDIHPPFYYLILRGWREPLGASEFSLRAFSAFVGVATVALTFALGRAIARDRPLVAYVAAFLTAANPTLIYYSQETRMYALLAFLAALSTLLFIRWQNASRANWPAVAYILCATAGLYTHYFFPAVLLAHGFLFFISRFPRFPSRVSLRQWLAVMVAIFLLYLPWLPIFIRQAGGRPTVRAPFLQFIVDSGHWLAFGATVEPQTVTWSLAAALLLLILGMGGRRALLVLVNLLVPVLFMFAAGTTEPQFFKFMLVAVPFFCLLVGLGIEGVSWLGKGGASVWMLLLVMLLLGNGRSLQNLYTNPAYARADYRGIAARIAAEAHPNAGVILNAPNQWEVFTYYHSDGAAVYPLPTGQRHPSPQEIDAQLSDIAARHDRLYVLFWGEAQRDPERLVERWLDQHAFKAREEWVSDVRFVTYAVPDAAATEMETAVNLRFGDYITLQGYTLLNDRLAPGDIVQITLFWQTTEVLNQRYKIFLHLLDAAGQRVNQRDSEPGGNLIPTPIWTPHETIIDNHGILVPPQAPPGQYTILLGLYELEDPAARLPIYTEQGVVEAFSITAVTVTGP